MVTDDQRREVAQKLRKQAAYCDGSLSEWWQRLQDTVTGEVDFADPKKTFEATADLIDRPERSMRDVGDEVEQVYRCSECGEEYCMSDFSKFPWRFCPNCGAEVLDEDSAN